MKILFVSAIFPYPLHSGGQVRIYNLLKRLSRRHEITLVSFVRDAHESLYKKDLSFCHAVYMIDRGRAWQLGYIARAIFTRMPFLLATYTNGKMYALLSKLLVMNTYDLIHLEPFYVWPSIPNTDIPIVVSEHNVEYEVYNEYVRRMTLPFLKPLLGIDVDKLKRWERYIWRKVTTLTAVAEHDRFVMEEYLSFPVAFVPNGVDTSWFTYKKKEHAQNRNFLFVGNFRWLPNREAAEWLLTDIWPKIATLFPKSTLTIVGQNIPERLQKLSLDRVRYLSDVFDIRQEYAKAFALIAPMTIAGGTKFKVLEAMACGTPVISTIEGIAGIRCEDEKEVLIAKNAQSFVDQLIRLDADPALFQRLTMNARRLVEHAYNWDTIAISLEKVWKGADGNKR